MTMRVPGSEPVSSSDWQLPVHTCANFSSVHDIRAHKLRMKLPYENKLTVPPWPHGVAK